MSSKLHRGDEVPLEAIAWPRVRPLADRHARCRRCPSQAAYRIRLAVRHTGAQARTDSRIQGALTSKASSEGQAARAQELAAQHRSHGAAAWRGALKNWPGCAPRFRHEAEEDVVELALAIARRILHRELTVAPEALLGLVKAALEKIEAREVHRVRVSREDAPHGAADSSKKMGLPQASGGYRRPEPAARRRYSGLHARRCWTPRSRRSSRRLNAASRTWCGGPSETCSLL